MNLLENLPIQHGTCGEDASKSLRVRGAMLEAPFSENRHVEAGHRLDAGSHHLTLQRIQPFVVPAGKLDERNALCHCDHRRADERAETDEAIQGERRVSASIT